jgi:hypothetical protein
LIKVEIRKVCGLLRRRDGQKLGPLEEDAAEWRGSAGRLRALGLSYVRLATGGVDSHARSFPWRLNAIARQTKRLLHAPGALCGQVQRV